MGATDGSSLKSLVIDFFEDDLQMAASVLSRLRALIECIAKNELMFPSLFPPSTGY